MKHADLAGRYFSHIRARNLEGLAVLFADDAVFVLPDGREMRGLEAIRGMYTQLFTIGAPLPDPQISILGPHGVATEIESKLPDGTVRRTANFFHVNADGRIQRLSVYMRNG